MRKLRRRKRLSWGVAGIVATVIAVVLIRLFYHPGTGIDSLAVLPFKNLSGDEGQEYFSDGLTEELMNALVKIPELRVTGRTSSFFFKGKNEDLQTISQKLRVAYVLVGSVRKAGNNIKIIVQLIEAESGFQLWSEKYERTLDDIFTVQEDITRSVARILALTPPDVETPEVERPDAEVHDLVLRARFVLSSDRSEGGTHRAREILERALEINPDYAPAWMGMNAVYAREYNPLAAMIGTQQRTLKERDKLLNARREVLQKALSLDPRLAAAHAGMAVVHLIRWDFGAAHRSAERAMELDPRNPAVMMHTRAVYSLLGRVHEALGLAELSVAADPLSLSYYANLAECYIDVGRFEDAEATCEEVLELKPDYWVAHWILGKVYLYQGRLAEAREAWERWGEHSPASDNLRLWSSAIIEHSAGNTSASDAALADYEQKYGEKEPLPCAEIRGWRGETDEAFKWLEKAYAVRDPQLAGLKVNVRLRSLHTDPRWNALLKRIGLPTD
jgi:TolB-like protein/Tfp pilus assembly protein PilF